MTKLKTFKKIAAMVMTFAMIMSFVPMAVSADNTAVVYDHEVELLKKLEILPDSLESKMDSQITRGEFSELLTAMLGVGGGGNAIEELYNLGIVHGYTNGKLEEDNNITTYEAVKMVVNALGYETLAELEGGYPLGYVKIAYDIDLLSGNVQNNEMTVKDAIRLIVDTGNSSMVKISNDTLLGGVEMGGKTMFYTYFDVVRTEGIMTADGFTSIGSNSCISGQVIINGVYFEDADSVASDLLGYYVEAYAFEDDMLPPLIAAGPMAEYNKEVTVAAESYIEATGNLAEFTVRYEDEKGAVKKITVGDGYFVIYNGKAFSGLTLTEHGTGFYNLNDGTADVTFIDNDRDGIYEFVKIDEYETYVVKSTNSSTFDVYAKYSKSINLDADKCDVLIYGAGGAVATFADLTNGTAVSVAESADGQLKKVYILSKTASGNISGISTVNGHQALKINGKEYIITKEFENLTHQDKFVPVMGGSFLVVLDRNGNIVDIQMVEDVWTYGYVMKTGYDENKESCSMLTLFDQSNKQLVFELGEKVVVDGKSYKTTDLVTPGICTSTGGYPKAVRQLIRYKASNGIITNIDTAIYNQGIEPEDSLQLSETRNDSSARYSKNSGYLYINDDVLFGGDDDTIMFTIPETEKYLNEVAYYSTQKLTSLSDRTQIVKPHAYNVNDSKIAKVIVRNVDNLKKANSSSNYVIVNQVSTVINKDGEAVYKVEGINLSNGAVYVGESTLRNIDNSTEGQQYLPQLVLADVSFGDCLKYYNSNIPGYGNVLWSVTKRVDAEGSVPGTFYENINNNVGNKTEYVSGGREYIGYITHADDSYFKVENGVASSYFKSEGRPIYLVDLAEETITKIDSLALHAYAQQNAKILVLTNTGQVTAAVIYTNVN